MSAHRPVVALAAVLLAGCSSAPPAAITPDPAQAAQAYAQRRLDDLPGLPPATAGWDRAQWLQAALALNPALAEARARAAAVAAGERSAAQIANPELSLSAGYISGEGAIAAAAQASGWLYGLALDILLPRRGDRQRAIDAARLRTRAAQAELLEAIWRLRANLREALLDAVSASEALQLLDAEVQTRAALLHSARLRVQAGDLAASDALRAELELADAQRRRDAMQTQAGEARAALAAAVGVPLAALENVPLRWRDWPQIDALDPGDLVALRGEALVARPDLLQALRECELREIDLQNQLARRWPDWRLSPALSWDRDSQEYALAVGLPLPLMNRNEGAIGEAFAERERAARELLAVQAQAFAEMDRAQQNWQQAAAAWQQAMDADALAQRQLAAGQHAFTLGASDRSALLDAALAQQESRLTVLDAAHKAQNAFAQLESAYRRPLQGPEIALPLRWRAEES